MNAETVGGLTDLHSHLIPGVDDGARTLADSLEGIGRLWEVGFRTLVTTPHLEGSLTRSPQLLEPRLREVDEAWDVLKTAAAEAFPDLRLFRGHEVMLDIPDPLLADPRIRLAGSTFVLVEWPYLKVPPQTPSVLAGLAEAGIKVILAHPERYHGLDAALNLAGEWRSAGARLQVNYGSLVGRYGDGARSKALRFLERGWVDLFSTDFHGRPHLSLHVDGARQAMDILGGLDQFEILARLNPTRVLDGSELYPVPPLQGNPGVWEKVRNLFRGRERG